MNNLFLKSTIEEIVIIPIVKPPPKPKKPKLFYLFLLMMIATLAIVYMIKRPFIEIDDEGNTTLAEWRTEKLNKELEELDEAEQYVLMAKRSGVFPCFSCENNTTIFLNKNDVWKYGYTAKGEQGRYQASLEDTGLKYVTQFTGTVGECMKEERRKIYYYALLPENLAREIPLIRPPGNKQDN